jgi:hypothetical protein
MEQYFPVAHWPRAWPSVQVFQAEALCVFYAGFCVVEAVSLCHESDEKRRRVQERDDEST